MTQPAVCLPAAAPDVTRRIGAVRGERRGPSLVVVAGIHGNEPAGVLAAQHFMAELGALRDHVRGEVVCFAGNVRALAAGVRYLDHDLNRGWSPARLAALPHNGRAEDAEQHELAGALDDARRAARGPVYFLDLHSTSAAGIPFTMVGRSPAARAFALRFPVPALLGLLELVDGTLLEYMRAQGCIALGFEAGQSTDPRSVEHDEAMLWIAVSAAGILSARHVPKLQRRRALLARARLGLPQFVRIESRHAITPADGFRMMPGFANIQRIQAEELLAHDRHGEVRAPRTGILLMPLYQAQGEDGFFLGRAVPVFGLRLRAAWQRWRSKIRLDR
jgi:succinylglutamate desuccinylase